MGSANCVQEEATMHMASPAIHPNTGKAIKYRILMEDPNMKPIWERGFGNEVGRLFQELRHIKRTNKCFFIELSKITKGIKSYLLLQLLVYQ
jgi:hypothetical protein